jgi:dolichyl-phosphate-mannose--protein O-mannosyl transferase
VQFLKKVKHDMTSSRLALVSGVVLIVVACAAFAIALFMHIARKPPGWSILAIIGGVYALGMAVLTLIMSLADRYARRLRDRED